MTLKPDEQSKAVISQTTIGLQVSSLLVHVFCCGLPLVVHMAALGGITGLTLLPLGFESWFHQNEIIIFYLAVAMVALSAVMYFTSRLHAAQAHHSHHDCEDHHNTDALELHPHCDHEDDCERRSSTGRWLLVASVLLLGLNAFMTFGFNHGHA